MRHLVIPTVILSLVLGCSGSDQQSPPQQTAVQQVPIPAAAATMDTKLTSGMAKHMSRVPRFEGILVGIFNPGTPLSQGVTLAPDNTLGAPPHSFTFSGPYDGNGDGFQETTITGRATFNSDPDVAWSGVTGQATLDITIPVLGHVYHATINFSITSAERRLSGSGTYFDPLTGNTTTMTVSAATPLVIKPATGAADAVSNTCGYSLNGPMQLEVTGPTGTLRSTWNFSFTSATVVANNRTFTNSSGQATALPDSTVDTTCDSGRTITDWVGTFTQDWACLPRESGQARLTLSVTGGDTISISDEDPLGSTPSTYPATTIGPNPHATRGFFLSGPVGFRYREDFNWTLSKDLSNFAQSSTYVFFEGPNTGQGGLCVGSAPRL